MLALTVTLTGCCWSLVEAFVLHTMLVNDELMTSQIVLPIRTTLKPLMSLNPSPVIVIRVPPACEPVLGDTEVIPGFSIK